MSNPFLQPTNLGRFVRGKATPVATPKLSLEEPSPPATWSDSVPSIPNPFVVLGKYMHRPDDVSPVLDAGQRQMALSDIKHTALTGLGLGAAAAGGYGLYRMIRDAIRPKAPRHYGATITKIPIPVEGEEKAAAPTNYTNLPYYYPGVIGAAGLGLYGGWKGVNALFNANRTNKDDEMNKAKQDFEQAMLTSYAKPRTLVKTASDDLSESLEALFEHATKQANWNDIKGGATGLYGTYALATGVPAAMWAYDRYKKTSPQAIMSKATKLRDRSNYLRRPGEIYAEPEPVPVRSLDSQVED